MSILFLCLGNSCRLIFAEAVYGKLALDELVDDQARLRAQQARIEGISSGHALQSPGERR